MLDLGLDHASKQAFLATLRSSHRIRLHVRLHDQDEKVIDSLSAPIQRVLSGSVQYDATQDVTRSLALTVLDPQRKLRFEANSPVTGAVYADKFVSVLYEVWVPDPATFPGGFGEFGLGEFGEGIFGGDAPAVTMGGTWVSVPVFWGPLTSYARAGAEVTLEAQGKESLLLAPHLVTDSYQLQRGTTLADAIERVAGQAGEARFRLPDLPQRLQATYPVPKQDEPWKVLAGGDRLHADFTSKNAATRNINVPAGRLVDGPKHGLVSMAPGHNTIYYDGHGRLAVRRLITNKVLTFAEGRDLLTHPSVSYDIASFRNHVEVTGKRLKATGNRSGGTPGNAPRKAFGRAELASGHPLSPKALSRNGKPRYLTEFRDTELRTDADCEQRAQEVLKRLADGGVSVTFDCLPMPHLEENDQIEVRTSEFSFTFPLRQWTLPLTADQPMTVGTNRRVRWRGGLRPRGSFSAPGRLVHHPGR